VTESVEVSAAAGQEVLHGEVVARALCNWGERLWKSILASTDEMSLASVRLDVNAPASHGVYHARWDRGPAADDLADLWRAEIPLRLLGRDVGRLEVSGYRDEEPVAVKTAALARMADIAVADLESAWPALGAEAGWNESGLPEQELQERIIEQLSACERTVLKLALEGLAADEIARRFGVSEPDVDDYLRSVVTAFGNNGVSETEIPENFERQLGAALARAEGSSLTREEFWAERVTVLIGQCDREQLEERRRAIRALQEIDDAAVPGLLKVLGDPRPVIRRRAAMLVGWLADHRPPPPGPGEQWSLAPAVAPLKDLLTSDDDVEVRQAAGNALDNLARFDRAAAAALASTVPGLREALGSKDPQARKDAACALKSLAIRAAGHQPEELKQALREKAVAPLKYLLLDDELRVRHAADAALTALLPFCPAAAEALASSVPWLREALADPSSPARVNAANGLTSLAVTAARQRPKELCEALASAVPGLRDRLGDPEERVRQAAGAALKALALFDRSAEDALTLANASESGHAQGAGLLEPPQPERGPVTPRGEEQETNRPGFVAQEPSPAEQLQAELVSRLKGLIPTLPADPEGKAREVVALTYTFNQAIRGALRDEMRPVVKQLLQDIPGDYEGKRERAALVNGLLTALDLGIQVHDDHGRPHVCGVIAARARETDYKGSFRLRERTVSGTSQKTYPVPSSPDQIQIIDTSRQEPAALPDRHQPSRSGRGG
jgi:HEAT repeat protein